jgi:hypothetical protein
MPIHDWTRVEANVYHDFHNTWISVLKIALNTGVLPRGYFALSDQRISTTGPDIIATRRSTEGSELPVGPTAVAVQPRVRLETERVAARQRRPRRIVVQTTDGHRVVAVIEITSPSNKDRRTHVDMIAQKVASYLDAGVHALVIDLLPPTRRDPHGIAGAVWEYFGRRRHRPTAEEPLSLASFRWSETGVEALIEPTAVGRPLAPMPLYLTPQFAVAAPLEGTYMQAFGGMAEPYREILERPQPPTGA